MAVVRQGQERSVRRGVATLPEKEIAFGESDGVYSEIVSNRGGGCYSLFYSCFSSGERDIVWRVNNGLYFD
ncbi:MAG: hypothetical protein LBI31_00390, partial [Zoogloeaceae bacterium]|nr:hypothetical protein [Zoogloeaceae bacterium]